MHKLGLHLRIKVKVENASCEERSSLLRYEFLQEQEKRLL